MESPDISLSENPKVLVEKSFDLKAGEMRRVFGRAQIASSTNSTLFVEVFTQCVGPNGTLSQLGNTNQNHEGKDTPIGPGYPWPGQLALYPSLLFKAPMAGKYVCRLMADADGNALTAVARDYDGFSDTWLQVSAANDAGASWWQNLPCDAKGDSVPTPTNGNSSCLYLGGASGQKEVNVFDNDGSPQMLWEAASDAAFVEASDSLLLTTCYYGTKSCTTENSESWWNQFVNDPGGTVVDSHLELIQLNSAGGECKVATSLEERSMVGNAPHHYMIYHTLLDVPVYPECGSHLFKLRMPVKWVSGNPVKVDGSSNGGGASAFTHAFAINSIYGTAPPVPNLEGLTESQARNSIAASGYIVSNVTYGLSTAPAGTVISQYPSAGIIELPGMALEFRVSSGGAVVPNLISDSEGSAIAAIKALALVPSVWFSKVCIEPKMVLTQSPPAGTLVVVGSTVRISVDSGTRQTCIFK
jgi:hypothetical protein